MVKYDGHFDVNDQRIYYRIVDDNSPIKTVRGQEKMQRWIYFYNEQSDLIKEKLLYDTIDVLQNVSHADAKEWFEES